MLAVDPGVVRDGLKLVLLAALGGGLLALGRWSSGLGSSPSDLPANLPTPDVASLVPGLIPKSWPPSAEEVAASLPFDPSLGNIRIRKFYFKKTDVTPGPADPDIFADELHIQLYDPDTDHDWWQSYFVATPQGLADILREKHWRYLHAPDVIVLPRFDLEEIRKAVVSRIVADHDYFQGNKDTEEDSL